MTEEQELTSINFHTQQSTSIDTGDLESGGIKSDSKEVVSSKGWTYETAVNLADYVLASAESSFVHDVDASFYNSEKTKNSLKVGILSATAGIMSTSVLALFENEGWRSALITVVILTILVNFATTIYTVYGFVQNFSLKVLNSSESSAKFGELARKIKDQFARPAEKRYNVITLTDWTQQRFNELEREKPFTRKTSQSAWEIKIKGEGITNIIKLPLEFRKIAGQEDLSLPSRSALQRPAQVDETDGVNTDDLNHLMKIQTGSLRSMNNKDLNGKNWTFETATNLANYVISSAQSSFIHGLDATYFNKQNTKNLLIVGILSAIATILSASILALFENWEEAFITVSILTVLINLFNSLYTVYGLVQNFSLKVLNHSESSAKFGELARRIKDQFSRPQDKRYDAITLTDWAQQRFDELEREKPFTRGQSEATWTKKINEEGLESIVQLPLELRKVDSSKGVFVPSVRFT